MDALIEVATPPDAADVAAVLRSSLEEFEKLYTPAAFAATALDAAGVEARMEQGRVWIARLDRRPVGTVGAMNRDDTVWIRGMAVAPEGRGQRLGRRLVDVVEDEARSLGIAKLRLSTTPFLTAAIALYRRAGYVSTTGGPSDLCGTPLVTMSKHLGLR